MNCTAISKIDVMIHLMFTYMQKGFECHGGGLFWLLAPIYPELAGFREIKPNIILGHVWDGMWWFITLDNSL